MKAKKSGAEDEPEGPVAEATPVLSVAEAETELLAEIEAVVFQSDATDESDGYAVYSVRPEADRKSAGAVKLTTGDPLKVAKGDKVKARGKWVEHPKYGQQFEASAVIHAVPVSGDGIRRWLEKAGIEGVGKGTAKRLRDHFGDRLGDVMGKPDELAESGIAEAKARAIAAEWGVGDSKLKLAALLHRYNLGTRAVRNAVNHLWKIAGEGLFSRDAIEALDENPWRLTEVEGIGFATADNIALARDHDSQSSARIRAGMAHVLKEAVDSEGNCGLPWRSLMMRSSRLLRVSERDIRPFMEEMREGIFPGYVYDEEVKLFYPEKTWRAERNVAEALRRLLEADGVAPGRGDDLVRAVTEEDGGPPLDPEQRAAVVAGLENGVSIITGGPGTGKSTSMRVLVAALLKMNKQVALAAPTGRAAKRLSETTNMPASTIHRLLEYNPAMGGFQRNEDEPIEADYLVVDEFSMTDIRICASLLAAVQGGTKLVIVGDVDQLPSVGPGQVLRDMIESGAVPTSRLETVHRTADDSGIPIASQLINNGAHPLSEDGDLAGVHVEDIEGSDETADRIVELVSRDLPAMGIDAGEDVQVLTSMRKGEVGIRELNRRLKDALNPADEGKESQKLGDRTFTVGDRVMHVKNNYNKGVFNGEVGRVSKIEKIEKEDGKWVDGITAVFEDHEVQYTSEDVRELEYCWAATVHKSQGCEFSNVVLAVAHEQAHMLVRNLIYTGVTRAKDRCFIVGSDDALRSGIARNDIGKRFTGLKKRIAPPEPKAEKTAVSAPAPSFGFGF